MVEIAIMICKVLNQSFIEIHSLDKTQPFTSQSNNESQKQNADRSHHLSAQKFLHETATWSAQSRLKWHLNIIKVVRVNIAIHGNNSIWSTFSATCSTNTLGAHTQKDRETHKKKPTNPFKCRFPHWFYVTHSAACCWCLGFVLSNVVK